ncbi:Bestrophin, RFP-TM, chloride channel-domain-containing protein [Amylocarpus encephaloides]|uniref:Bestrophin, RFP-TM, chloride channel-domain-containing protein n=1 Tax=Amylocarpus encephaloides TaxID=45428 RepID=A0A9P7Y7K8_9HELO|nr:Bestrophin, RFP-TM, chloride channel-domain-containing protein [Amylocarpus encephaloides]
MADEGVPAGHGIARDASAEVVPPKFNNASRKSTLTKSAFDVNVTSYTGDSTPVGGSRESIELTDYFVGPRNLDRHSKLPYFMQMHGSVLPRMLVPLTLTGAWATLITVLSTYVYKLSVSNVLLTIMGFVVGLALSFRSSTAYERYSDGRKSWTVLSIQSRNLARYIWVHTIEREGEDGKDDLLGKITAMNMILAFSVSLKHKLRFEPYAHYPDIASLVGHLDTFAKAAHKEENTVTQKKTFWKQTGEYLGLTMANSNPRKLIKRAEAPLGNMPLEILTYLSSYIEEIVNNETMKQAVVASQMLSCLGTLTDAQANAERVLTTPLPVGYNILISQIVILYTYLLPFQLISTLGWITIPGTVAAAYIIMGLSAIGNELENPFGNDVNDLPLDTYCSELSQELDILMSVKAPKFGDFLKHSQDNQILWPLSSSPYGDWKDRSEADIRSALRAKVIVGKKFANGEEARPRPSLRERVHNGSSV